MNRLKDTLILAALLLTFSFTVQAQDCSILKDGGTFVYGDNNDKSVVIDGVSHTETHPNGVIKSTMTWTSDCEYSMTIDEVTIPDFPFAAGATMTVVINAVEGNEISYTSTINGDSWESKMVRAE